MHDGGWWSYIRYDEKQDRPAVSGTLVRRAAAYGRPYAGKIAVMLGIILAITLLNLVPPLLTRNLIDYALPQGDVVRLSLLALGMIVVALLAGLLSVGQRYLSAIIGEGVIYDLRVALYSHLQHMSLRFFTHTKTGELMSRLNNDVGGAQRAVTGTFVDLITNVVTLILVLAIMLRLEWHLTLLAVAVLPLFLIPARLLGRRVRSAVREQMMYNAEMNAMMEETLNVSGALLVKLFGRTTSEVLRFSERAARVRRIGVRQAFLMRWFFLTVGLISAVGTALVFWVGGILVLQRQLQRGHHRRVHRVPGDALRATVCADQRSHGLRYLDGELRAGLRGAGSAGGDRRAARCAAVGVGGGARAVRGRIFQLPARRAHARRRGRGAG